MRNQTKTLKYRLGILTDKILWYGEHVGVNEGVVPRIDEYHGNGDVGEVVH